MTRPHTAPDWQARGLWDGTISLIVVPLKPFRKDVVIDKPELCKLPFSVGDRIWVRESWREEHPISIQEGRYSQQGRAGIPGPPSVQYRTIYRTDGDPLQAWRREDSMHPYFTLDGPADEISARYPTVSSTFNRADGKGAHWTSPVTMPRWASRMDLIVTSLRAGRVQSITHDEIMRSRVTEYTFDKWHANLWCAFAGVTVERKGETNDQT